MADECAAQSQIDLSLLRDHNDILQGNSTEALLSRDALELARVGKREVLKRRFRLASTVGFASSVMITWEAMMIQYGVGLKNGGPAGLIYGYIGVWVAFFSLFITMGELASMMPSAGGQYHWTSILAPTSSKRFLSYINGVIGIIAWIVTITGNYSVAASVLQYTVLIDKPQYDPQGWHVTFITWGILLLSTLVVTYLGVILPAIELLILTIHVFGFAAVVISLVALGPKADSSSIFTLFLDLGGWHDIALSTFVGLQGTSVAFIGMDAAVHMAEEVENSSLVVPQAMLLAILINGILGFAMLVTILLKSGDIYAIMNSDTKYPFMFVLENSLQSKAAAIILSGMINVLTACAGLSAIASGSRMLWSFSREQGIPGWRWISQVHPRTFMPNHSTFVIVIMAGLLCLNSIGSAFVLSITLSLILQGFLLSYSIPLSLLLYRRIKGQIAGPSEDTDKPFVWGPFRLRGWIGVLNNIFSLCSIAIMFFFGSWPLSNHPAPGEVNYGIAITGGVSILAVAYYFGWARKYYHGPVVEVQIYNRR